MQTKNQDNYDVSSVGVQPPPLHPATQSMEFKGNDAVFKAIFDAAAELNLVLNRTCTILHANPATLKALGYSYDELVGLGIVDVLTPASQQFLADNFGVLIDTGVHRHELELLGKNNRIIPADCVVSLLNDSRGEIDYIIFSLRDITNSKHAEKNLRETKEQLEYFIKTSLDPIAVSDNNGHIIKVNEAFCRMVGFTPEDLIGRMFYEFSPLDTGTYKTTTGESITIDQSFHAESAEKIAELLEQGRISGWKTFYRNSSNVLVPVTQDIVVQHDDDGNRTSSFAIIHDTTEQRLVELELIQAKNAAIQANNSKSNFLANMSHEIRTPMNAVIGFSDMLFETDLNADQLDFARTIKQSGEALLSLINDILDFSKVEAGKIDFEEMEFDLEVLAYDVCDIIRPRAQKDVELLCRIDDRLPALVKADPHRYKQVLINLMSNAVKFTLSGEIELSIDVETDNGDQVLVHAKVRDTGIGIPADKLDLIFEVFQQADESTTRKFGGTGLGLSISKKIATLMGGDVWAESTQGAGSVFHFTTLVQKSPKRPVRKPTRISLEGKRVLVTDDNRTNIEILTHVLESAHMHVRCFSTGGEALEALREARSVGNPFDIAVLDIMMPDMTGFYLARQIRSTVSETIPLLAFSSSTAKGEARKSQTAGFNGFLPKPVKRIKLFQMMERLLADADLPPDDTCPKGFVTQYSLREDKKHTMTILLAEDNPVNQKLGKLLLTRAGYEVDLADNGKIAIEKYTADPARYDIIFMDIQMPEINGFDATALLREKGYTNIPIIAMTANAMKGDREKCIAAGMNDYISKPIKRDIVFDILSKWAME